VKGLTEVKKIGKFEDNETSLSLFHPELQKLV